jgi:hypothetical protein
MSLVLLRDLNLEWSRIARSSQAREALVRWSPTEPALKEFGDLEQIIERAHHPDRSKRDDVLAALIRIGQDDKLAWRVVLHVLMPGLVCTAHRFSSSSHTSEEVVATLVTVAWQRIASYPLDRRPRNIGGNIGLDTRQIASGLLFRNSGVEVPTLELTHTRAASRVRRDPAVQLLELLGRAVKSNVISLDDARLVALTRIQDVPVDELAAERGVLPHSLRRRRLRIEAALPSAAV